MLSDGDRIEYGVTHELTVDGEKAWVRFGVNASVASAETAEEATARVTKFVNAMVVQQATEVASQIMGS
jgi:hypothetical protein